jgi:cobalt-zinc-cadmium efflux system membrane fusion protein
MTDRHHLLTALLAATLALGGCGDKPAGQAAAAEPPAKEHAKADEHADSLKLDEAEAQRAGIRLETLSEQAQADTVTVTATVRANPDRVVRIAPRVEGRLTAIAAKLGDRVQAGQAMATLDSLAVGEAATAWAHAQSALRIADADLKRAEALNADEIIPKKDFLRVQSEREMAAASLRAAEDRLRLLGVAVPRSAERLASTFAVTAPFAGTVIEKAATLGQLASPSEPLFVVADLSRVWIEADLGEALLAKVKPGAAATVTVSAYPGERFSGKLTHVAAVLDKDKRTVAARIELDNKDGRLKPEMFATAIITTGAPGTPATAKVLSVPDEAIVLLQGQPTVFVFEHEGYEARAIEPGTKAGGRTVVKSGLKAGEQVVAAGAYALKARVLKSQISDEH